MSGEKVRSDEIDENELINAVFENYRSACNHWKDNQNEPKPKFAKLIKNAGIVYKNKLHYKYEKWLAETYDEVFKFKYFDNSSERDIAKDNLCALYKKDKDEFDALPEDEQIFTKMPTLRGYNKMALEQGLILSPIKSVNYYYKSWYEEKFKKPFHSKKYINVLPEELNEELETLVQIYFNENLNVENNSIKSMPSHYRNKNFSPGLKVYAEASKIQKRLVFENIRQKLKHRCETHNPPVIFIGICGVCEICGANLSNCKVCNFCGNQKRNKRILEIIKRYFTKPDYTVREIKNILPTIEQPEVVQVATSTIEGKDDDVVVNIDSHMSPIPNAGIQLDVEIGEEVEDDFEDDVEDEELDSEFELEEDEEL